MNINIKAFIRLALRLLALEVALLIFAVCMRNVIGKDYFLADAANFGFTFGVIGTVYTLIAAFVLFGVWGQYNALSDLIAKESRTLTALWAYAEYFNDTKLDTDLRASLLSYINKTLNHEIKILAQGKEVDTYSSEFQEIGRVIDRIEPNDDKGGNVFPLIIKGYGDLLDVRGQRNEAGITRLPLSMKMLFTIFSFLLVASALIFGFVHMALYLSNVAFIGVVAILTYMVVMDMDNPFGGLFELQPSLLREAKEYIEKADHKL